MPTGYTYDVSIGKIKDFSNFALLCSRAMMPLISMRDEPFSAKIPDVFKPSDYSLKRSKEKQEELDNLLKSSEKEIISLYKKDRKEKIVSFTKAIKDAKKSNENCLKMLAKVRAWKEPADCNHFKKFMIEQLEMSMSSTEYYEKEIRNINTNFDQKSPKQWFDEKVDFLRTEVKYYEDEYRKDVERANYSTKWVQDLKKSLKQPKKQYAKKR